MARGKKPLFWTREDMRLLNVFFAVLSGERLCLSISMPDMKEALAESTGKPFGVNAGTKVQFPSAPTEQLGSTANFPASLL